MKKGKKSKSVAVVIFANFSALSLSSPCLDFFHCFFILKTSQQSCKFSEICFEFPLPVF